MIAEHPSAPACELTEARLLVQQLELAVANLAECDPAHIDMLPFSWMGQPVASVELLRVIRDELTRTVNRVDRYRTLQSQRAVTWIV